MKLWIDECLTPTLVGRANDRGYWATCNRDRGLLGALDENLHPIVIEYWMRHWTTSSGRLRRPPRSLPTGCSTSESKSTQAEWSSTTTWLSRPERSRSGSSCPSLDMARRTRRSKEARLAERARVVASAKPGR